VVRERDYPQHGSQRPRRFTGASIIRTPRVLEQDAEFFGVKRYGEAGQPRSQRPTDDIIIEIPVHPR